MPIMGLGSYSVSDFISFSDEVYFRFFVRQFEACWPLLLDAFGQNPPAATMIECGLLDPKFRIEIEVTAVLP